MSLAFPTQAGSGTLCRPVCPGPGLCLVLLLFPKQHLPQPHPQHPIPSQQPPPSHALPLPTFAFSPLLYLPTPAPFPSHVVGWTLFPFGQVVCAFPGFQEGTLPCWLCPGRPLTFVSHHKPTLSLVVLHPVTPQPPPHALPLCGLAPFPSHPTRQGWMDLNNCSLHMHTHTRTSALSVGRISK